MGRRIVDRVGQQFGFFNCLTVVALAPQRSTCGNYAMWLVDCDWCGTKGHLVRDDALQRVLSCGCLRGLRPPRPKKEKIPLSQTRLHELFDYNSTTGEFFSKTARASCVKIGERAGGINSNKGYWEICIDGKKYAAHRLAFLYTHGYLPKELDHKDRNRSNNRIANLRPASRSENAANSKAQRNTRSGRKGVWWHGTGWQAVIRRKGQRFHLGTFSTPELAHAAYMAKARALFGEFACDGSTP